MKTRTGFVSNSSSSSFVISFHGCSDSQKKRVIDLLNRVVKDGDGESEYTEKEDSVEGDISWNDDYRFDVFDNIEWMGIPKANITTWA